MSAPTLYLLSIGLIFGLLIGSFLNVVVYRFPLNLLARYKRDSNEFLEEYGDQIKDEHIKLNIVTPRSHCPKCKAPVKAWQNIPVVSWLFLKGKCAKCQAPISKRYPLVELATGLISAFVVVQHGATLETLLLLVFSWSLISLTLIDIDRQLLPDEITLPLLWLGLVASVDNIFVDPKSAIIGAAAGYLSLWSVYWLFKLATGKEGMGYGDFKLLAVLGAWMGWQQLPFIILASALVGAIIGIAGIVILGRDKNLKIPFGPYLAIAGWIAMFWGDTITSAYLNYMSGAN